MVQEHRPRQQRIYALHDYDMPWSDVADEPCGSAGEACGPVQDWVQDCGRATCYREDLGRFWHKNVVGTQPIVRQDGGHVYLYGEVVKRYNRAARKGFKCAVMMQRGLDKPGGDIEEFHVPNLQEAKRIACEKIYGYDDRACLWIESS